MTTFGFYVPTLRGVEFPSPDTVIWRYLDLPRYLDVLVNRRLYLSRLDLLGDPYEGFIPPPSVLKSLFEKRLDETGSTLTEKNRAAFERSHSTLHAMGWAWRYACFVSCWHRSDEESHGMWKAYLESALGVVLRSTVGKLAAVAHLAEMKAYLGEVKYFSSADKDPSVSNFGTLPFRKRRQYADEREIRLLVQRVDLLQRHQPALGCAPPTEWPRGIEMPIHKYSFIDEIRFSPGMPAWIKSLIQKLTDSTCAGLQIVDSDLSDIPDWAPR
jgi:hypothetical protein